ncbi:putative RNA-directed DNA polymerase from transposon BS [Lasiodiplodia theobromae]|uniref:Putative RNA-directed DNA polymerase from transposon BS n=1 Tax=Lasiodiplodia theobromae TaxID=45133 RepID=A0A5N5CTC1_9PEZI|nr:putative RNA-directed DNA polymerase from transposon BS [Lasiodiplodia theobromae]
MWIRKDTQARQIAVPSADITAAVITLRDRVVFVAAVYVAKKENVDDPELTSALGHLRAAATEVGSQTNGVLELLICGDFNRHDQLWGGDQVYSSLRNGEGAPIIDFMEDFHLQSLLPRGTVTYESAGQSSTIDLILASPRLTEEMSDCSPASTAYGHDHLAVEAHFEIDVPHQELEAQYAFRSANWEAIRSDTRKRLAEEPPPDGKDIESFADYLSKTVSAAVLRSVPKARPSPYVKKWWTADLTQLRRSFTYFRNQARGRRRWGQPDTWLEAQAREAAKRFHDTMRRQKRRCWKDFLAEPTNVWKAARYLSEPGSSGFARIARLQRQDGYAESCEEISETLIKSFFPELPEVRSPQIGAAPSLGEPIKHAPLTVEEVKEAIFRASPFKAPGPDGIPVVVWRELWPVVGKHIHQLFSESLAQGRLPNQWRIARIVPLRKAGKSAEVPQGYRPISLLSTLGKALESVVAERISALAEEHSLLPKNHFGGRKQRSTVQALTVLQQRIYDAWREGKVLSLLSFDVKGAYNGVARDVLLHRLRQRRIPEVLIRWVEAFCSNRSASVVVNGKTSRVTDLPQAGLPQGSPLSPILFLFFNADLVQSVTNKNKGAIAFIDDYSAWVTGSSASENVAKLQRTVVAQAEEWEAASGATFEAEKTTLVHFTRNEQRRCNQPVVVKGREVHPKTEAKILGVVFDQELRFKAHAGRIAKRGVQAALALKRLQGLRPSSVRQLFAATVAPTVDYAAPVWAPAITAPLMKSLEAVQRIAGRAITGAFRTVALPILEAEAAILPVGIRLHQQLLRFWVNCHTLPQKHPFWRLKRAIDPTNKRFVSPLQRIMLMARGIDVEHLETNRPFVRMPWADRPVVQIESLEAARLRASSPPESEVAIFTHGLQRNGRAGSGVSCVDSRGMTVVAHSSTVGKSDSVDALFAELQAIHEAVGLIRGTWSTAMVARFPEAAKVKHVVYSDNKTALRLLHKPRQMARQETVGSVLQSLDRIKCNGGPPVEFRWVPAHQGIKGNERARSLALQATENSQEQPLDNLLRSSAMTRCKEITSRLWRKTFEASKAGESIRKLDRALAHFHTKKLYDQLNCREAAVIAQLRTSKASLNEPLYKIKRAEGSACNCGAERETVKHFLLECPRWMDLRAKLQVELGSRFGDLAFMLGGWSGTKKPDGRYADGPPEKWRADVRAVKATAAFALATGRLIATKD